MSGSQNMVRDLTSTHNNNRNNYTSNNQTQDAGSRRSVNDNLVVRSDSRSRNSENIRPVSRQDTIPMVVMQVQEIYYLIMITEEEEIIILVRDKR